MTDPSVPGDEHLASEAPEPGEPSAAEICENVRLGKKARALLQPTHARGEFLALLVDEQLYADAIRFMARVLELRAAVWWACLCIEHALGEKLTGEDLTALVAATAWVLNPDEDNHERAGTAAAAAGLGCPAGCLAEPPTSAARHRSRISQ